MAITLFGTAVTPADDGTNAAGNDTDPTPIVITPPSSMVAGQLVIVTLGVRSNNNTASVVESGGQTWNYSGKIPLTAVGSATCHHYWCRFNGTWSANPSFQTTHVGSADAMSVVMSVFSPNSAGSTWAVDTAIVRDSDTVLAASPNTVTLGDITTTANGALAVAGCVWTDNVNDSVYTANGWSTAIVGQDNGTGTGLCLTVMYKIMAVAGSTGDFLLAASTGLFNDACLATIESYLETPAVNKGRLLMGKLYGP